jgi:hypothetical protein
MSALIPSINPSVLPQTNLSLRQAKNLKEEAVWESLQNTGLKRAIEVWLETLSSLTAMNYRSAMAQLIEHGLLDPFMSLQQFALTNGDAIVDQIKRVSKWSETTRQARAAAFISFTRFLSRRTEGVIKKALPSREGVTKTFFRVHDKVVSNAMTQAQWSRFFQELEKIN